MTRILFVGQKPETVDFSDPALPPGFSADKINAGIALRQLKRFEEAAVTFSEVLAMTPDDAIACLNLGLSLRALQRDEEALSWLRKASDLRPSHGRGDAS